MTVRSNQRGEGELTLAISAAMLELYSAFYKHERTTATTYINGSVVVCLLEAILTEQEDRLISEGGEEDALDGRIAFQADSEDEFTAMIERLTHRHVEAFMSANEMDRGVACELFFLDAAPIASRSCGSR